jgi:hypothetical protein
MTRRFCFRSQPGSRPWVVMADPVFAVRDALPWTAWPQALNSISPRDHSGTRVTSEA